MPIRVTMTDLIYKIRQLIGDKLSSSYPAQFTDQEIQDALDSRREFVRYAPLRPEGTPQPFSGIIQYLDFFATAGYWESDAQLYGPAWQPLSPATADFIAGHWTFSTTIIPTVFIVGKLYDLYGVAADLMDAWNGQGAGDNFDVRTQGRMYARSQITTNRIKLAEVYRSRAWAVSVNQVRGDLMPETGVGLPLSSDRTSV